MNANITEKLYDLFDEACMILYDELKLDYISALSRFSADILEDVNESLLSERAVKRLNELHQEIMELDVNSKEEIRFVLQLLSIKGLKHNYYALDMMVPDSIGFLMASVINGKFRDKPFSILDTTLKNANMLLAIEERLESSEHQWYGIEQDEKLIDLAIAQSNVLNVEIKIFPFESDSDIYNVFDIVIGYLMSSYQEQKYLPYEVLLKRIENVVNGGYFLYLIDNDFFMQSGIQELKNNLEKSATLVGLITLPVEMVQANQVGKSILIGKKEVLNSFEMLIVQIKDFQEETLFEAVNNIKKMIDKI